MSLIPPSTADGIEQDMDVRARPLGDTLSQDDVGQFPLHSVPRIDLISSRMSIY